MPSLPQQATDIQAGKSILLNQCYALQQPWVNSWCPITETIAIRLSSYHSKIGRISQQKSNVSCSSNFVLRCPIIPDPFNPELLALMAGDVTSERSNQFRLPVWLMICLFTHIFSSPVSVTMMDRCAQMFPVCHLIPSVFLAIYQSRTLSSQWKHAILYYFTNCALQRKTKRHVSASYQSAIYAYLSTSS